MLLRIWFPEDTGVPTLDFVKTLCVSRSPRSAFVTVPTTSTAFLQRGVVMVTAVVVTIVVIIAT